MFLIENFEKKSARLLVQKKEEDLQVKLLLENKEISMQLLKKRWLNFANSLLAVKKYFE